MTSEGTSDAWSGETVSTCCVRARVNDYRAPEAVNLPRGTEGVGDLF